MKDIRNVFRYHGAEHKAVFCHEAGEKLTIENVKKYSTLHPRCGTSFILIVFVLFILIFSLIPIELPFWILFFVRLLFVLPIAGLAYEFLKLAGKYRDSSCSKILSSPGLWIQKITTKEPNKKQIEVAIKALKSVV